MTSSPIRSNRCRSCGSTSLVPMLDLGMTPLADRLMTDKTLHEPEPVFPLAVVICRSAAWCRFSKRSIRAMLFGDDYPYFSSFSQGLLRHFAGTVASSAQASALDGSSLVVELASNDGYLLKNYVERGIPVLGIDPAPAPPRRRRSGGIPTLHEFFTRALARRTAGCGPPGRRHPRQQRAGPRGRHRTASSPASRAAEGRRHRRHRSSPTCAT